MNHGPIADLIFGGALAVAAASAMIYHYIGYLLGGRYKHESEDV